MTRFLSSALSILAVLTGLVVGLTPPVAWAFVAASPSRPFSGWGQSVVSSKTKHNHLATPKATSSSPATDATILPSTTTAPEAITPDNWALLSERGRAALLNLMKHDATRQAQTHVYGNWPDAGTDDDGKQRLAEQVCGLFCFLLFWVVVFMVVVDIGRLLCMLRHTLVTSKANLRNCWFVLVSCLWICFNSDCFACSIT